MSKTKRKKRQDFVEGAIVRIAYEGGEHTYAQLLVDPWIRVFDAAGKEFADLSQLVTRPVLFKVAIHTFAVIEGRWPIVGHVPLRPEDRRIPDQFVQDLLNPANLRILTTSTDGDWKERPATAAECEGLEAASVWDPEHVETRIADHYAGRPNMALHADRLVRPGEVFTVIIDRGQDARGNWVVSGRVHATLRAGDRVSAGPDRRVLTIATIKTYLGDREIGTVPAGQSAMLQLAGDVTPDILAERVLRTAETD